MFSYFIPKQVVKTRLANLSWAKPFLNIFSDLETHVEKLKKECGNVILDFDELSKELDEIRHKSFSVNFVIDLYEQNKFVNEEEKIKLITLWKYKILFFFAKSIEEKINKYNLNPENNEASDMKDAVGLFEQIEWFCNSSKMCYYSQLFHERRNKNQQIANATITAAKGAGVVVSAFTMPVAVTAVAGLFFYKTYNTMPGWTKSAELTFRIRHLAKDCQELATGREPIKKIF